VIRIIPRLDIKGPNLVKGIHFEGLRVLGKPEFYAKHYYENGADELIFMDAVASLYGRNSLLGIIEKTSREIFIPLTVGGGLRSVGDIREVLRAGADKVAINTAAVKRPELIREASRAFGSSTIVLSIEAIKTAGGGYEAYTDYGREGTGLDALDWAIKGAELGAGEIMVTSIDREGTGKGLDLELIRAIAEALPIPVIASGGAGRVNDVAEAAKVGKADAVALASLLHYNAVTCYPYQHSDFSREGNIEFLRQPQSGFGKITAATLQEIKANLIDFGVACRMSRRGA